MYWFGAYKRAWLKKKYLEVVIFEISHKWIRPPWEYIELQRLELMMGEWGK